jgi:hypothetical protein
LARRAEQKLATLRWQGCLVTCSSQIHSEDKTILLQKNLSDLDENIKQTFMQYRTVIPVKQMNPAINCGEFQGGGQSKGSSVIPQWYLGKKTELGLRQSTLRRDL